MPIAGRVGVRPISSSSSASSPDTFGRIVSQPGLSAGPAAALKAEALTDDFLTNSGKFVLASSFSVTGGQLRGVYTTAYETAVSAVMYDLTESSVTVQMVHSAAHANNETWFAFGDPGGVFDSPNALQFIVSSGTMYFRERVNSTSSDASVAYDATAMAWVRFRESAGVTYWETAPALAGPWTVRRSKANAFVPNNQLVKFSAGNFNSTQTSYAAFDNVNPQATPPYNPSQFLAFF